LLFWEKIRLPFHKVEKTKNPIDEIKTGCGWMDVVDADIKTVDEKDPPTSSRLPAGIEVT
jgi:hypothetical protein